MLGDEDGRWVHRFDSGLDVWYDIDGVGGEFCGCGHFGPPHGLDPYLGRGGTAGDVPGQIP
jgi:hypothetical protein